MALFSRSARKHRRPSREPAFGPGEPLPPAGAGAAQPPGPDPAGGAQAGPRRLAFTPADPPATVPAPAPAPPPAAAGRRPTAPMPWGTPPASVFDQLAAEAGCPLVLPCALCGARHEDATAGEWELMIRRMHRTAFDAGWDCDGYGRWCCPACLPPACLPAVPGGIPGEVDMMIRARVRSRDYDDLPRDWRRFDRAERRRREIADLHGNWRVAS